MMIYGCAAVLQWGIPSTTDAIRSSVGPLYYDMDGLEESGEDEDEARSPMPASVETAQSMRAKTWANRHIDQSEPRLRTIGEAMDVVALLWSQSRPKRHEKPPPTQEEDLVVRAIAGMAWQVQVPWFFFLFYKPRLQLAEKVYMYILDPLFH